MILKQSKRTITKIFIFCYLFIIHCSNDQVSKIWPTNGWKESPAKTQGMNYDSLSAFSEILESGTLGYIDGMLIIKNGMIVFEKKYNNNYDSLYKSTNTPPGKYNYYDSNWHPYYKNSDLHTMQSASKSFTSAAIGVALKKNLLPDIEESIMDYFEDYRSATPNRLRNEMTIKNVLTMTTGIRWDESSMPYTDPISNCVQMESSTDWVQYVIDQPMLYKPGDEFEYNSGATMLLSYIIEKVSGKDLSEFLEVNLFNILGIKDYYWKHTPKGLTDAEGGLYLTPRDLAKFGYLYLNKGNWNGKQILPVDWVERTINNSIDTAWPNFKYSFQWWLMPYGDGQTALLASGLGGQRMIILTQYNIVAVFTGWNVYNIPSLNSWMAMNKIINALK